MICSICGNNLVKNPSNLFICENCEIGYSIFPYQSMIYNKFYIQEFFERSVSDFGKRLIKARIKFIKKFIPRKFSILDFGCGAGSIVKELSKKKWKIYGYDPMFFHSEQFFYHFLPIYAEFDTILFFDSFEHLEVPSKILLYYNPIFVIITIPIFPNTTFSSRHFKPFEHLIYFTDFGLKKYFQNFGYNLIKESDFETLLGRKSIKTYCFKKND